MNHEPNSIRIFGPTDPDSGKPKAVGAGILVAADHILTCTHVVTAAQGSPNAPMPDPARPVRFDWPLLPRSRGAPECLARPVQSRPLMTDPTVADVADITLLRIDRPQALSDAARPARLLELSQPYGREAAAYGFHRGQGDVVRLTLLGKVATGAVQIEQRPGYPEVDTGFSGAAVREADSWTVVGMLVRRDDREQARTTCMIPAVQLLQVLAEAGITNSRSTNDRAQAARVDRQYSRSSPRTGAAGRSSAAIMSDYDRDQMEATRALLTQVASGNPEENRALLERAFARRENDPRPHLVIAGDPAALASQWLAKLEQARCIDGHSPLVLLIRTWCLGRRDPATVYRDGFQRLMRALDAPCGGDGGGGGDPRGAADPGGSPQGPSIQDLREFLSALPIWHNPSDMRAFLQAALGEDHPALASTPLEGNRHTIIATLARNLTRFDLAKLADGSHGVCGLLREARLWGHDADARVAKLMARVAGGLGCR